MYKNFDVSCGMPSRLYRSLTEIRRDMSRISEDIRVANEQINLRSLLTELLDNSRYQKPEEMVLDLKEAVDCAQGALKRLSELKEELCALEEELCDTRCVLGV